MICICHGCKNYKSAVDDRPHYRKCDKCGKTFFARPESVAIWCSECYCGEPSVYVKPKPAPKPQYNSLPDAKMPEPQRPEPGEGWRLLDMGEPTQAGDEEWDGLERMWGIPLQYNPSLRHRRRIAPAAQDCPHKTYDAISAIVAERERQDEKWGEQNHSWEHWLVILMEEVGEASQSALKGHANEYRMEMVQVAAVALNAIECFDRNRLALREGKP